MPIAPRRRRSGPRCASPLAAVCFLVAFGAVSACRLGPEAVARAAERPPAASPAPVSAAPVSAAPARVNPPSAATSTAVVPVRPSSPPARAEGPHLELPANVAWQSWEAGLARAKAENKPIVLLIWAHWCPRCRELAPTFGDPEIAALSQSVVMVEQNADERPAWLAERFDSLYGGYVPRVFVLRPDGTVRTDITSGNPQYPYFYVPQNKAALANSIKRALNG